MASLVIYKDSRNLSWSERFVGKSYSKQENNHSQRASAEWSWSSSPYSSPSPLCLMATWNQRHFHWPTSKTSSKTLMPKTQWTPDQALPRSSWWQTPTCWERWRLWKGTCPRGSWVLKAEMKVQTSALAFPSSKGTPRGAWWEECTDHAGKSSSCGGVRRRRRGNPDRTLWSWSAVHAFICILRFAIKLQKYYFVLCLSCLFSNLSFLL